jgi:hypothetical protein
MKEIVKTKSLSLFSADTLDSIAMAEVFGGEAPNNCNGGNCVPGCNCKIETNVSVPGSCAKIYCPGNAGFTMLLEETSNPALGLSQTAYSSLDEISGKVAF